MTQQVTKSKKDRDGDITGLCGAAWSHTKSQAVTNIGADRWAYSVLAAGQTTYVRVGTRNGKDYLTTNADSTGRNNLDNLPDC
ncbi:uncharacterized protein DUF3892 [Frigoribacterium sp. PhB107]|jgi:hypothetical protein|nr:DUF3892 domain-containing protein [Frigoribacterium sp. PhB107]ROP72947.1 uncharacterized protein DUF3892 [Frigoribacterium sp. PhB107]